MPNAIRIISQQRMTENLRAGFRRALVQVPGARDFQFYENRYNVSADHDTASNGAGHSDNFGCDWNFFNDPKMLEIRS